MIDVNKTIEETKVKDKYESNANGVFTKLFHATDKYGKTAAISFNILVNGEVVISVNTSDEGIVSAKFSGLDADRFAVALRDKLFEHQYGEEDDDDGKDDDWGWVYDEELEQDVPFP